MGRSKFPCGLVSGLIHASAKYSVVLLFILMIASFTAIAQDQYIIQNVQVISMVTPGITAAQDVHISNGIIHKIGDHGSLDAPGAMVIDGSGKFLTPGISEMHAHIPVAQDGDDTYVRETLFLYLSNGITTIRGMLGNPYHLDLIEQVSNGEILSPRIYTSSPSLNGNSVQTPEEAEAKVRAFKRDGYDFLKIHPGIKAEVMERLVDVADKVGIRFAGHVPFEVGIRDAIKYKYWSIDHVDGFVRGLSGAHDESEVGFFGAGLIDKVSLKGLAKLSKSMHKNDVWVVPTQSLFTRWISPEPPEQMIQADEMQYMPARTRYAWVSAKSSMLESEDFSENTYKQFLDLRIALIKSLYDHDVKFLLGSDAPQVFNVPGFSIQHEMSALAVAGLSNEAILKSGTVNPAEFFNAAGSYGQITEGASADLLLLHGNPLENIDHMRDIDGGYGPRDVAIKR